MCWPSDGDRQLAPRKQSLDDYLDNVLASFSTTYDAVYRSNIRCLHVVEIVSKCMCDGGEEDDK